jgi:predicted CXXCH cytochrome family protein
MLKRLMQNKEQLLKIMKIVSLISACFVSIAFIASLSFAAVTGNCANCHTMHNSQDNSAILRTGTVAGSKTAWNGSNVLAGGTVQSAPTGTLLVTDCVGCHSASTDTTIVTAGGNRIPIVFNTGNYPTNPLAGGNFYSVSQGNDAHGHNVYGISDTDSALTMAPGNTQCFAGTCHFTLADPPSGTNFGTGGCQGCHYVVSHHDDVDSGYRYLKGHNVGTNWVLGAEDPDWEYDPDVAHNGYKGAIISAVGEPQSLSEIQTISSFCGGCHNNFHKQGASGTGDGNPWIRHPTDIALPGGATEFAGYDPTTTGDYDALAPVAWTDPADQTDRDTAVVMCLSCHRPHGSLYDDILRWDYMTDCFAGGNGGTPANCGCFVCHTWKD